MDVLHGVKGKRRRILLLCFVMSLLLFFTSAASKSTFAALGNIISPIFSIICLMSVLDALNNGMSTKLQMLLKGKE